MYADTRYKPCPLTTRNETRVWQVRRTAEIVVGLVLQRPEPRSRPPFRVYVNVNFPGAAMPARTASAETAGTPRAVHP